MRLSQMMNGGTRLVLGLFLLGGISACNLNDVLQVSDPSRFTDESLDNPNALPAVANGVQGNFDFSIANIVIYTGLLSDELMHTGTWSQYEDADKGRMRPPPGIGFNIASDAIRLRADKAAERFERVLGDSANRTDLMATVKTIRGWQNIMKAETQCEAVVEPGGAAVPDDQVWAAAVSDLEAALTVAQAANSQFWTDMAHAGLARANLNLGNYDAALTNAQAVSDGFEYVAHYSETSTSNSLVTLNYYKENKAAGLDSRRWAQVDTTDPSGRDYYIDPWTSERDSLRVPIAFRAVENRLGVDGITKFFSQDKYNDRGSDIPVTHKNEMLLIEAEVYWNKGQFQTAIDRMNTVREHFGLSPLTNPGTSQGVLNMLLEERFATLFLEGQRANDLYRFGLFPSVIGSGFNTKFPMDGNEMINNPNIPQPRSCPVLS